MKKPRRVIFSQRYKSLLSEEIREGHAKANRISQKIESGWIQDGFRISSSGIMAVTIKINLYGLVTKQDEFAPLTNLIPEDYSTSDSVRRVSYSFLAWA